MGVLKTSKISGFCQIDNGVLQRTDLSAEARGTIAYLVSKPADWRIRKSYTGEQMGMGKDKTNRVFAELQALRYLVSVSKRGTNGQMEAWDWIASDHPIPEGAENDGRFTETGAWVSQCTEKPGSGQSATTKEREIQIQPKDKELRTNVVSPDGEPDTPPNIITSGKVVLRPTFTPPKKNNIEDMLALGLANKPKPAPKTNEPDYSPFFDAWNELAPNLPSVTERGRRGLQQVKNKFKGLIREFGYDEAVTIFEDGCKEVNLDDFWREKRYGIDNLARHAVSKAEKWASRKEQPKDSDFPEGMDPNSPEATAWLLSNGDLHGRRAGQRRNNDRRKP